MRREIDIQPGDFFLVNSNKTGAKIVKGLQTAPTVWQHLWRKYKGTQETVEFYHVGLFKNKDEIIEQQWKVVEKSSAKLLNTGNEVLILRKKEISKYHQTELVAYAEKDLGEGYDVLNCFGKLFTWLTGIPYFARYMEMSDRDICINRVAYWYRKAIGSTFGAKTHSELTTHTLYKYVMSHLGDEWVIVYRGVPRNEV